MIETEVRFVEVGSLKHSHPHEYYQSLNTYLLLMVVDVECLEEVEYIFSIKLAFQCDEPASLCIRVICPLDINP